MLNREAGTGNNRGGTRVLLVVAIVVFVVALIGVFVLTGSVSTSEAKKIDELHMVDRGDFTVSFPASGELSSSEFMEIRNPLDTTGVIKYIVDEGTTVKEGDMLVHLNQESLEEAIEKLLDRLLE